MKITLDLEKTIDQNANNYFSKAKDLRKKITKIEETIQTFKKKQENFTKEEFESEYTKITSEKKHWFEKFKWSVTQEGFLLVAGRDATTNEILIKKHTSPNDVVFHTDMAGSPFVVIKKEGDLPEEFGIPSEENIGEQSLQDAAAFTAIHSRAWKMGLSTTEVFWVTPEQVSKEANSGESLSRGSFVIRGKTTYLHPNMDFVIGVRTEKEPILLSGPRETIQKLCSIVIPIEQGKEKSSVVARQIRKQCQEAKLDPEIDEIIRHLPSGGCQVKKERKRKHNL